MKRRSFLKGALAALAASALPAPQTEHIVEESTVQWTMMIYGTPIIYHPRKTLILTEINS